MRLAILRKSSIFLPLLRNVSIFIFTALAFALVFSAFQSNTTRAAEIPNFYSKDSTVYKNTSANQHYFWLYQCFRNNDIDKITTSEMNSWDFFKGKASYDPVLGAMYPGEPSMINTGGVYLKSSGRRSCDSESLIKTAFGMLDQSDPRVAFCSIDFWKYDNGEDGNTKDDCIADATGSNYDNDGGTREGVAKSFESNFHKNKPPFGAPEEYLRSYLTLTSKNGCSLAATSDVKIYTNAADIPGVDSKTIYAAPVASKSEDGRFTVGFIKAAGTSTDKVVEYVATRQEKTGSLTDKAATGKRCGDIAVIARDNVQAYVTWLNDNPDEANAMSDTPVDDAKEKGSGVETSCNIDGIGWVICPIMTFLGKMNDIAFRFIDGLLTVETGLYDSSSETQKAWEKFRDLANAAFVIVFLIIIYSQITGAAISNYGIKKLLPKLIIAALAVNLSYYICQIMIDLSNIFGASLNSFLGDFAGAPEQGTGETASSWDKLIAGVLIGGAAIGLIAVILLAPTVLIAVASVALILIARKAILIILVVISPLAFVAYLLPNTEDWFKKWWKIFTALLLVFPVVGLIFGASTMVSNILMGVAAGAGDKDQSEMLAIVALAAMGIPLFAVPTVLKGAISAAGAIGQKVSGLQDRANTRAKQGISDGRIGEFNNARKLRRAQNKANARLGQGRMSRYGNVATKMGAKALGDRLQKYDIAKAGAKFDRSAAGRYIGGDKGAAAAVVASSKLGNDAVDNAAAVLSYGDAGTKIQRAQQELIDASKSGDVIRARAAYKVLSSSGGRGNTTLDDTLAHMDSNGGFSGDVRAALQSDAVGSKAASAARDRWAVSGDTSFSDIATRADTLGGLTEAELASQTEDSLNDALHANNISQATAQRVIHQNATGNISLSDNKLRIFQSVVNGPASQKPAQRNGSLIPAPGDRYGAPGRESFTPSTRNRSGI